jgi:hypothetical protein
MIDKGPVVRRGLSGTDIWAYTGGSEGRGLDRARQVGYTSDQRAEPAAGRANPCRGCSTAYKAGAGGQMNR